MVGAPPLVAGPAGGARGAGGGGLLCLRLSLCPPPRVGIKAGRSVVALPPALHRLAFACHRPDAACGVPLRAGAGQLARRGYSGSGRAADRGLAAYGSVYRGSGAPPRVPRPYRWGVSLWLGGGGAGRPFPWLGCPWAGGGRGRRGGGGGALRCPPPLVPRCCSPVAAVGLLDALSPGGTAVDGGGGGVPLPLPRVLGCRAGLQPRAPPSSRRVAPAGGGEGSQALGVAVRVIG